MKKDITNQKFGRLTAKEVVRTVLGKGNMWRCECECGGEKEVPAAYLLNGHTRSCGCMNAERQARLDITGQRWGATCGRVPCRIYHGRANRKEAGCVALAM